MKASKRAQAWTPESPGWRSTTLRAGTYAVQVKYWHHSDTGDMSVGVFLLKSNMARHVIWQLTCCVSTAERGHGLYG